MRRTHPELYASLAEAHSGGCAGISAARTTNNPPASGSSALRLFDVPPDTADGSIAEQCVFGQKRLPAVRLLAHLYTQSIMPVGRYFESNLVQLRVAYVSGHCHHCWHKILALGMRINITKVPNRHGELPLYLQRYKSSMRCQLSTDIIRKLRSRCSIKDETQLREVEAPKVFSDPTHLH